MKSLKEKIKSYQKDIEEDQNSSSINSKEYIKDSKEIKKDDIENYDNLQWIDLRTKYANKLYYLLIGEVVTIFILVFLVGLEWLKIDKWVLNILITGVMAQTFGLVRTIVKNLFSKNGK